MGKLLIIGAGGFVGAVLRYTISGAAQSLSRSVNFPYGTLTVNLIGCLVIGFLARLADAHGMFNPETRLFLFIGLLGAFTTYSTFGNETFALLRGGESLPALTNLTLHIVLGLGAVWAGQMLADALFRV